MRYVQLKALQGADRKPMVFGFDGEYSIVADPSGGSVDAMVNTVIRDLSLALNLVFTYVVHPPSVVRVETPLTSAVASALSGS